MLFGTKFGPYPNMQELNLDWIMTKIRNMLRFLPDDGSVGQILRRTPSGAEWSNESGGGGAVDSVNGQTGTVVLTAADVNALPDTYTAPVSSVNGQTGAVTVTKSDVGLGNVANVLQYSASNPPPYPVTSVNSQTGAVTLSFTKSDVGLGNVANVLQYSASNPPPYPVTSVNGQTGDVIVSGGSIQHQLVQGTTNSGGLLSTTILASQYVIIGMAINRNIAGYYTGYYSVISGGVDASGYNSIRAFTYATNPVALSSEAIAVDVYYMAL